MPVRVGLESEDQMESEGGIILLFVHTPIVCRKYALSGVDVHLRELPWSIWAIRPSNVRVWSCPCARSCGAVPPP